MSLLSAVGAQRLIDMIATALGPLSVLAKDPAIVEIMANPDGRVWYERVGEPMVASEVVLTVEQRYAIIQLVSGAVHLECDSRHPRLAAIIPESRLRFRAWVPPVAEAPTFTARKPAMQIFTLEDYVRDGIMTEAQRLEVENAILARKNIAIAGGTGCHGAGTPILMWDGSVKNVEDVEVGDQVMGPDSQPRHVMSLCRGRQPLYRILPKKGDPWTANLDHILHLVSTPRYAGQQIRTCNVSLRDYFGWSKKRKHLHKLVSVPVEFPPVPLPIAPYDMGVLLGDGSLQSTVAISKPDPEIQAVAHALGSEFGLKVTAYGTGTSVSLRLTGERLGRWKTHPLIQVLAQLHLRVACEDKFIPLLYQRAAREQRLALLAGLLDTDGHCSTGGYDFISKSFQLATDLTTVARSIGLRARLTPAEKGCPTANGYYRGHYWRVSLSGDCSVIPCRLARKHATPRQQKKRSEVSGFTIELMAEDAPFYGFTLAEDDGLYLLGDYTVTHNSGKTTALNACLVVLVNTGHRIITIEALPELQCAAPNRVALYTRPGLASVRELVQDSLQGRPDRIIVGEVIDGAAYDVIKAWNTGHPGGLCTIHADSVAETFERLEDLAAENPDAPGAERLARRIRRTIDLVVFIKRTATGRVVEEVYHG